MYIDKKELLEFVEDRIMHHEKQIEVSNIPSVIESNTGASNALKSIKGFIEKDIFTVKDYDEFLLKRGYDPTQELTSQNPSLLRMIYYRVYFFIRNKLH